MIRPVRSSGESTWIIVSPWGLAGGRPVRRAARAPRRCPNRREGAGDGGRARLELEGVRAPDPVERRLAAICGR